MRRKSSRTHKETLGQPQTEPPSIDDAVAILDIAYTDLNTATTKMKRRQAAEKGWLAARTLAQATLACAGENWQMAEGIVSRLRRMEQTLERQQPPRLYDAARDASNSLHGACFYNGTTEACEVEAIRYGFDKIKAAFPRAKRLCTIGARRKGRK